MEIDAIFKAVADLTLARGICPELILETSLAFLAGKFGAWAAGEARFALVRYVGCDKSRARHLLGRLKSVGSVIQPGEIQRFAEVCGRVLAPKETP